MRTPRRLVSGLSVAALAVASVIAASPQAGATAPAQASSGQSAPGVLVPLLAGPSIGHSEVPPPVPTGQVSTESATITVNYSGFTAQAQAAFQAAVNIWQQQITSTVPIVIDASYVPLGSNILGESGPNDIERNFSGAPQANTWYPVALANALHGSDLDPTHTDAQAQFSSNFPNWYFGTDGNAPSNTYDFESVVLHELGHALGFIGSADVSGTGMSTSGSWGQSGSPYIYDKFTEDGPGTKLTNTVTYPNPSHALAVALTGGNGGVFFNGPATDAAGGGNRAVLFAPNPWQGGSSYSHLDEATYGTGNINSLMTPVLHQGEVIHDPGPVMRGMFTDMGWPQPVAPGAPASPITATPGSNEATVSFSPPLSNGGSAITSYTVTASPGGATGTGPSSPVNIAGLSSSQSYSFTVTATNAFGTGPPSAASNAVQPVLDGFVPLAPDRILDTRFGTSPQCPDCQNIVGPLGPGTTTTVQITGQGSTPVPSNATAVVMNVTATAPTAAGWLTVWDTGAVPTASNLNFLGGQTVPNLVTVKLGPSGRVQLGNTNGGATAGTVQAIFDVVGYYIADGTGQQITATTPTRILDTRSGVPSVNPRNTPLAPQEVMTVNVGPTASIPSGATAAVINVTSTGPTAAGWLTVWPTGPAPTASNINFTAGQTVPNLAIVKINQADQTVQLGNTTPGTGGGSVNAIFDVVGWIGPTATDGGFNATTPKRILDTRFGVAGANTRNTPLAPQEQTLIQVAGFGGVPTSGASAVVLNVTATGPTAQGWLTIWPTGTIPTASNLNFDAGQTVPNLVTVKLGPGGTVRLGNTVGNSFAGAVNVIFDVVGWYTTPS